MRKHDEKIEEEVTVTSNGIARSTGTSFAQMISAQPDPIKRALLRGFEKSERHILDFSQRIGNRDGSTALVVMMVNNTLYVANLGDSRAVLCRNGRAVALTEDHKPHQPGERRRIEHAGGTVRAALESKNACCCFGAMKVPKGALRLWPGGFSVSRTLGDIDYKILKRNKVSSLDILVAFPDLVSLTVTPQDEFVILGSDGLWDVVSNEEAVQLVVKARAKRQFDADTIARRLVERAYTLGSEDNITCLVLFFVPLIQ